MQQYIIGNWKMNGTTTQAQSLAKAFLKNLSESSLPLPHIVLCPSYPYLTTVLEILKDSPIKVGAQDCHFEPNGAFTGDVSASQLADVGCKFVIIGHSERRHHHHEGNLLIQKKMGAAIKAGLRPILCIGESAEERKAGKALSIISAQLSSDLPADVNSADLLIAYEPLWAIGTGLTPTLTEVEEVMGFLKRELTQRFLGGAFIPTLYGGSVTSHNATSLLELPHVDGLLVGGASLKADEFWNIIGGSRR